MTLAKKDRQERRDNFIGAIREIIGETSVQALKYK